MSHCPARSLDGVPCRLPADGHRNHEAVERLDGEPAAVIYWRASAVPMIRRCAEGQRSQLCSDQWTA